MGETVSVCLLVSLWGRRLATVGWLSWEMHTCEKCVSGFLCFVDMSMFACGCGRERDLFVLLYSHHYPVSVSVSDGVHH